MTLRSITELRNRLSSTFGQPLVRLSSTPVSHDRKNYFGANEPQKKGKLEILSTNFLGSAKNLLSQLCNISLDQLQSKSFEKAVHDLVAELSGLLKLVGDKSRIIQSHVKVFVNKMVKSVFDSISSLSNKTKNTMVQLTKKLVSLVNKLSEKLDGLVSQQIVKSIISGALATVFLLLTIGFACGIAFLLANPAIIMAMTLSTILAFLTFSVAHYAVNFKSSGESTFLG
ncbi:MAG: hypothetical protein QG673_454 [Pseudomonadota bacterium]|nr:hypothetical protein [Pseudomonadota bacterium]